MIAWCEKLKFYLPRLPMFSLVCITVRLSKIQFYIRWGVASMLWWFHGLSEDGKSRVSSCLESVPTHQAPRLFFTSTLATCCTIHKRSGVASAIGYWSFPCFGNATVSAAEYFVICNCFHFSHQRTSLSQCLWGGRSQGASLSWAWWRLLFPSGKSIHQSLSGSPLVFWFVRSRVFTSRCHVGCTCESVGQRKE